MYYFIKEIDILMKFMKSLQIFALRDKRRIYSNIIRKRKKNDVTIDQVNHHNFFLIVIRLKLFLCHFLGTLIHICVYKQWRILMGTHGSHGSPQISITRLGIIIYLFCMCRIG